VSLRPSFNSLRTFREDNKGSIVIFMVLLDVHVQVLVPQQVTPSFKLPVIAEEANANLHWVRTALPEFTVLSFYVLVAPTAVFREGPLLEGTFFVISHYMFRPNWPSSGVTG
jgi:hypothetical protein